MEAVWGCTRGRTIALCVRAALTSPVRDTQSARDLGGVTAFDGTRDASAMWSASISRKPRRPVTSLHVARLNTAMGLAQAFQHCNVGTHASLADDNYTSIRPHATLMNTSAHHYISHTAFQLLLHLGRRIRQDLAGNTGSRVPLLARLLIFAMRSNTRRHRSGIHRVAARCQATARGSTVAFAFCLRRTARGRLLCLRELRELSQLFRRHTHTFLSGRPA
jgi:hypothetical protein